MTNSGSLCTCSAEFKKYRFIPALYPADVRPGGVVPRPPALSPESGDGVGANGDDANRVIFNDPFQPVGRGEVELSSDGVGMTVWPLVVIVLRMNITSIELPACIERNLLWVESQTD